MLRRSLEWGDKRNLTRIEDLVNSANTGSFTYTANGFLASAEGPWGELDYQSDGVGNITQRSLTLGGITSTDAYLLQSGSNRLSSVTTGGVSSRTFQSDASGNIIEDATVSPASTKEYSYNAAGQLISATVNSTAAGAYGYDYLSRLTTRTVGSTTLHLVHDLDGNVIAEYDSTGTLITEYVWLDGRPLAVIADAGSSPTLYYVLTDHLERPLMLADESRTIVWQATYLPFGEVATLSGSATAW